MGEDRRDDTIRMRIPNGRRREDRILNTHRAQHERRLVIAIPDRDTGRLIRLVRPDSDTDSPTAA